MVTATHLVHYRKFVASGGVTDTLAELCRKALSRKDAGGVVMWERADDRVQDLGDAEKRQILLNKVADLTDAVFGEMCLSQQSGLQALLRKKATKVKLSNVTTTEIYDLSDNMAPQGSQFVRGMAYWMAIGNHLFFVKTQSMSPLLIRGYLDWLLMGAPAVLKAGATYDLKAELDRTQFAGDIGDIQSVRVTGQAVPQLSITPANDKRYKRTVATQKTVAERGLEFAAAMKIYEAVFGEPRAESLVKSLGPKEYLTVDTKFTVRGTRTEESREQMKDIATELADTHDGKVLVEGRDGRLSDDDAILRTKMPFELSADGANLLDFDNVADQLREVYTRFVKDGKIKA